VPGPGCAAEGMTVPLAVKELRPLRGAFGVLDREPLARHRQIEGQARGLPQQSPRSPVTGAIVRATDMPQRQSSGARKLRPAGSARAAEQAIYRGAQERGLSPKQ